MSTFLVVCTILVTIGIVLFILSFFIHGKDSSNALFTGVLVLAAISGFIGFGVVASFTDHSHKIEQIHIDTIVKSSTTIYVELIDGQKLEYTSKKLYDEINMDTKIYKVTYFNHYGYKNPSELYLLDTLVIE